MSSYSSFSMSTRRKEAFSEELGTMLGRRSVMTSSEEHHITTFFRQQSEEFGGVEIQEILDEVADIFVVTHNFRADSVDAISLRKGDLVEVVDTGNDSAKRLRLDPDLDLGDLSSLLDNSAARHKLSVRPRRKHTDSRQRDSGLEETRWLVRSMDDPTLQGWVPASVLERSDGEELTKHSELSRPEVAQSRREAAVRELVETEEEFGRDLQQVVERYQKPLDNTSVPHVVRENRDVIFSNFKQIADFHNTVLIEGVKYYANEPRMLGKTFLRLERDFDKHVAYCRDEPAAQELLQENEMVRDYFEERSQQLGDDKSLSEHLKLPIQRINDYQLLLKELVKYSSRLGEDTSDLQKALELMLGVPHRADDIKFTSSIEGYHGNIHKLGRLLRHEWFTVTDKEGKCKERYIFLFKARILICKVKRISDDRSVFILKDIIRLPEVEVKDHRENQKVFELYHKTPYFGNFPLTLTAHKENIKEGWLKEIRQYASDVIALAEHAADDLQIQPLPEPVKEQNPPKETGITVNSLKVLDLSSSEETSLQTDLEAEQELTQKVVNSEFTQKSKEQAPTLESVEPIFTSKSIEPTPAPQPVESTITPKPVEPTPTPRPEEPTPASKSIEPTPASKSIEPTPAPKPVEPTLTPKSVEPTLAPKPFEPTPAQKPIPETVEPTPAPKPVEAKPTPKPVEPTHTSKPVEPIPKSQIIEPIPAPKSVSPTSTSKIVESTPEPKSVEPTFVPKPAEPTSAPKLVEQTPSPKPVKPTPEPKPVEPTTAQKSIEQKPIKPTPEPFEPTPAPKQVEPTPGPKPVEPTPAQKPIKPTPEPIEPTPAPKPVEPTPAPKSAEPAPTTKPAEPVPEPKRVEQTPLLETVDLVNISQPQPTKNQEELEVESTNTLSKKVKVARAENDTEMAEYSSVKTKRISSSSSSVQDEKNSFVGLETSELLEPGVQPSFSWIKDGQPYDPEERFKVLFKDEEDSLALVFQHVKPEDAGLYTCVASTSTGKISCSAELTVQGSINQLQREPVAPKVMVETEATEVSIGGSAMLELKVQGYPKPEVKWSKDGKDVEAGGRVRFLYEDEESISMIIKGVTVDDAGKYKVSAKNELGVDTAQLELIVKAPPKIKTKMQDSSCMTDEPVTMTVEVEGVPVPEIKWYKDGQQINQTDRVKIKKETSEKYTLSIEKTKIEDGGSYSVVASNEISQTSEFWQFTVHSGPQFVKSLNSSIDTNEGDTITLEVKVQGDPKPEVKWLKNGEELKGDGKHITVSQDGLSHTLTISGITRNDTSQYTCEVWNDYGWKKSDCQINVKCAPKFRTKLSDQQASEGDTNIEFTINVEAYPKPKVSWYLNEVEITEKKTEYTKIEEGDNYKLIIKEVTTELSGKYSVKVVNDLGSNESDSTFTVNYKPKFPKKLKDVEVDEGDSLTLTIECSGVPEPKVKWYKDGQEVSADANIKISRNSSRLEEYNLTVNIVKGKDSGVYEARAENSMGSATTKSTVKINTLPEILDSNLSDQKIYESLGTTFEVKATGIPRPEAKWYKDGEEIKPSSRAKLSDNGDTYKLEIKDALISDAGTYKCKIVNRLGEKSQEAILSLMSVNDLRKPKVKVPLKDTSVPKNEEAVLSCVIVADPIPDIKWSHDGSELAADENVVFNLSTKEVDDGLKECTFTLTLPSGKHSDTGKYKISAKNKYGEDESSARLDILLVPEIDGLQDSTKIPYEDIEFEVIILANPKPQVVWTKDGQKLSNSEHTKISGDIEKEVYKLLISNIGLGDDGTYVVTATNNRGESSQQAKLTVHTEVPTFLKKIEDQTIKDYEDTEIRVRANGVPKVQIKWFKDGKELKSGDRLTIETDSEVLVSSCLSIKHFEESDEGKYSVTASNLVGQAEISAKLILAQIPPSFPRPFDRAAEVDEGETLELKTKLDGSPIPKVKWYKDGEELKGDDRIKLTALPDGTVRLLIDQVIPTDCGAYKLIAINKNGQAQAICAVAVKPNNRKPSFSKPLEDAKAVVGQPLKLEAQVMAFPAPEIKWFKDGHPIRPSQALNFVNQPGGVIGLLIDSVRPEDAGKYTLTVSNKLGDITGSANVEVEAREKKPVFQCQLQPLTVVEGFPAKLEVKAVGHPPPVIKWTHNGKEIVPDGKHIKVIEQPDGTTCLIIDKAKPEDAGDYEVTATNDKGAISTKGHLDVTGKGRDAPEEKPDFVHDLRDVTVNEGTPLLLGAPFLGNPIPDVTWTKDGEIITPSDRVLLTCDGKKVGLEIKPARLGDGGVYTCKLKNPLGEAESSAKASIRKVYQAPSFTQKFTDLQQLPTHDAKFLARVTGVPQPDITWYFNDKPIKESGNHHLKRDGDVCCLYVKDCKPSDAGRYKCKATNLDGEASCEANLEVVDKIENTQKVEPPEFLKRIGDCEVYKSMTAKFTACASGYPEPEFEWYRGDEKLYPSDRIRMEKEGSGLLRLSIANVDPSDVGRYRLRIFNPHGEASCEADLNYDSLDSRPKRPIGDQYTEYDKFRKSGAPLPLADKPIISRMTDRRLTLSWKPSIPIGSRVPVTYRVEMSEQPDGEWFTARTGYKPISVPPYQATLGEKRCMLRILNKLPKY